MQVTAPDQDGRCRTESRSARLLRFSRLQMQQCVTAGLKGSAYCTACVAAAAMATVLYKMAGYSWLMRAPQDPQQHRNVLLKLAPQNLAAMQDVMVPMGVFVGACFATFGLLLCHAEQESSAETGLEGSRRPLTEEER